MTVGCAWASGVMWKRRGMMLLHYPRKIDPLKVALAGPGVETDCERNPHASED